MVYRIRFSREYLAFIGSVIGESVKGLFKVFRYLIFCLIAFVLLACQQGEGLLDKQGNPTPSDANTSLPVTLPDEATTTPAMPSELNLNLPQEPLGQLTKDETLNFSQKTLLPDMFVEKEAGSDVTFKVKPQLKLGETLGDLPSVDGATFDVKMKTR